MAQFYELASLDEVWHVYPNVQVENADSVQYMVQDDKIIQYTDASQNQKVLTAIDHPSVQLSHGSASGQQGVFLIETVEASTLDPAKLAAGPEQPKVIVQPINPSFQAPQQILTSQQPLIIQSGGESLPSGIENKSQCIMQIDKNNKPVQVIGQQAQYVIAHPNSLPTHFITTQQAQQQQQPEQDSKAGVVQGDVILQKNQQSFIVPAIDTSPQKTVADLGKQTRQLVVQSADGGGKSNSYVITQQLTTANQMQNQIVVNQVKGNKIVQTVDGNQVKDSVRMQNVDGSHFVTQQLEMSGKAQQSPQQQQQKFQTQHFIVPQMDRLQPKIVVQRVEMPKQMPSQPQLIVQQIQVGPTGQGTQLVVRQLDPNQDRSSMPYVVTAPGNITADLGAVESRTFKSEDKVNDRGENVTVQETSSKEAIVGVNKHQEKLKESSQSRFAIEQLQSRMNQQIQTVNSNERLVALQNEEQLRFVQQQQQQIGVQQQNQILQRFPLQTAQIPQFYNKDGRLIQGFPVQNVNTVDQSKSGMEAAENRQQIILQTQHDQKPPPTQQEQQQQTTEFFIQSDKTQQVQTPPSSSPTQVPNLPQYRRVSLVQNEGEAYPGGVYIIPKGNNQVYISQYPGQVVDADGGKAQQSSCKPSVQQETKGAEQTKKPLVNVQTSEGSRTAAVPAVEKLAATGSEFAQLQLTLASQQQQQTETQLDATLKTSVGVVPPSSSPSTAVTSLPQYRRVSLKQNEELCPGSVYIIPKGSNQMYISQYQPGLRLQESQAAVQGDGGGLQQTTSTVTEMVETSTQSVIPQQKADDSQKTAMSANQSKRVAAKVQPSAGSRPTATVMTVNKSAETTSEFAQIQVNLSQQQQTETELDTTLKTSVGVVPPSSSPSTTVTSLPQYRRVSLKQSEGESGPGNVYIIPKGSNQMYISQCQPDIRLNESQIGTQADGDGNKVQQTVETSTQSSQQQAVIGDSQMPTTGTNQVKKSVPKMESAVGNRTTVVAVDKSAETSRECDQIQVGLQSQQQQQQRISLKPGEGDLYSGNVYIIPKGSNQMYISQCQPGLRFQESQVLAQVDGGGNRIQQTGGTVTQTVGTSTQSDAQPQEPDDSQKSLTGVSQSKRAATKVQTPTGNRNVGTGTADKSAETATEHVQCGQAQINLQSPQQQQQQQQTISTPNQIGIAKTGVGRGVRAGVSLPVQRGMVFRMVQYTPMPRGVQVQGTTARLPQSADPVKKQDAKTGTPGLISCGQEIREESVSPVIYQFANASVGTSPGAANVESSDETRKFIIAPNGERKLIRVPASQQNVNINQLLQQVRFSLGSPISIVANDQIVEKTSTGQIVIKSIALENQDAQTVQHDPNSQTQIIGVQTQNLITTPAGNLQHAARPTRGMSPRLVTTSPGAMRSVRMQIAAAPRLPSPRVINNRMVTPPQHQTQSVLTQTAGTPVTVQGAREAGPQQYPKDMPKFIPGQVAICPFCGISSVDFNRCVRCRRKLPANVKSQSLLNAKKKKLEKPNASDESIEGTKFDLGSRGNESPKTNVDSRDKSLLSSPVGDKRRPKPARKKKISDEPAEILILSSDEEEEATPKKVDVSRELPTIVKEPVYGAMSLSQEEIAAATKGNNLVDDLMENVQPGSYTTLQCRLLRIGSYRTHTKERVLISSKGVKLVIQSLKSEPVTIVIPIAEILKILIHYGKQIPLVFIYATPKMGFQIRSQLGMENNKTGPYYDPAAQQEETHKRITLLLEKMTEDNKIALHNMFSQSKLVDELSEEEANEILVRASSCEEQVAAAQAAAAAAAAAAGGLTRQMDTVRKIMVYPPPPEKGGIALNNQDYACLGEDQFLNDVIIDFYLKYLLLKVLSPEDRERTHIFSTFFYKRLTTKPKTFRKNDPENDPKLSAAEKRHMRVKGWTKKVNLFEKDFIIVPINEHSHWFLAIICFPGLTGPVKFSDNTPVEVDEVKPKKNTQTLQIGNTTITHIIKTERATVNVELDPGSDRDEAEADQDDLHPSSDDEESEQAEEEGGATESTGNSSTQVEIPLISTPQPKETKMKQPVKKKPFKEPIKQPCILIFDSLAGASRVRVVATLRDYLKIEYKTKMGQEREFTKDTIKGAVLKVPQQNNFTDCGLYVLQYVESFFQDPLNDFKLPLKYLQDWFPEEVVACKRQELASLIRTLMEEQGIKVEEMGLPNLTFANGNNTGEEQAKLEEEEEEEEEEDEMNCDEEEMAKATAVAVCSDGVPTVYYFRKEVENEEEEEEEDMDLDEEDMDLGEDEEEAEEVEEEEDEEMYEELELDEMQEGRVRLASSQSSDMDLEGVQSKSGILIQVDTLGSDEEGFRTDGKMRTIYEKFGNDVGKRVVCIAKPQQVQVAAAAMAGGKSVPLTEFQDFESQITCTTIEKSTDSSGVVTERVAMSEADEVEDEDEDEGRGSDEVVASGVESLERRAIELHEKIAKEKKALDVTNMLTKLVRDKGITVRRKEDGSSPECGVGGGVRSNANCDNAGASEAKLVNKNGGQQEQQQCVKRSSDALKSVRIRKKGERTMYLTKRQKIDET